MRNALIITVLIILILTGGGLYYWYFYIHTPTNTAPTITNTETTNPSFLPLNNNQYQSNKNNSVETNTSASTTSTKTESVQDYKVPKLRQLSTTPIAGMAIASSTSNVSTVRFIDRGTGYVYQADNLSEDIKKISNTTIPGVYEAYGNKNASEFLIRFIKDESNTITNFYTTLKATGTSTSETPYELKGKYLSTDIKQVTVSPNREKMFTWNIENGGGVGYISSFDDKSKVKISNNPLTQVTIDWPEINTVTLATKASGASSGFIYTIDIKTGTMKKVLGGIRGLTARMNKDLSRVIFSSKTVDGFSTSMFNTKDRITKDVIFKTLPEKCVWSIMRKNEIYCAVPTEIPPALYPDDWYKGEVSFVDQIWYLNTNTDEVHLISNLFSDSNQLIDAVNLTLDQNENFLYFTNKKDLTLWALDLNQ